MSRNHKLALIITIEYVINMLLCAVLVGATNISHVVPVVIICIAGSTLVSLNTKITGDIEEKKNRSVVSYSGSIKLVLLLGASFEEGYGNISTNLLVAGFVISAIIFFTEMLMYVKNTRSKYLKYYALVTYMIIYVVAAINIHHIWVMLFCLPLFTAYSQFENKKLVFVGVVYINAVNFWYIMINNLFAKENYSIYNEWNSIVILYLWYRILL